MNRELKFRVWFEKDSFGPSRMIYSPRIYIEQSPELNIMQFTGLKDKDGKEIYEGDICEASKPNSYLEGKYEVAWHETKGRWYYKNQPSYKDLYQVGCQGNLKCKVIGNIFENPKLLNDN